MARSVCLCRDTFAQAIYSSDHLERATAHIKPSLEARCSGLPLLGSVE